MDDMPMIQQRGEGGAFLCGPRVPTAEDLAVVATYRAWLEGDRSVWDDQGFGWTEPFQVNNI